MEDFPLTARPFSDIASRIGISEEKLIEKIKSLKKKGVLRRFGASLNHKKAGIKANAMVAWIVPEDKIDEIGYFMANFKEITHCYHRKTDGNWRYNLFTMIHGKTKNDCKKLSKKISDMTGLKNYTILSTLKEYKKTSPQYF